MRTRLKAVGLASMVLACIVLVSWIRPELLVWSCIGITVGLSFYRQRARQVLAVLSAACLPYFWAVAASEFMLLRPAKSLAEIKAGFDEYSAYSSADFPWFLLLLITVYCLFAAIMMRLAGIKSKIANVLLLLLSLFVIFLSALLKLGPFVLLLSLAELNSPLLSLPPILTFAGMLLGVKLMLLAKINPRTVVVLAFLALVPPVLIVKSAMLRVSAPLELRDTSTAVFMAGLRIHYLHAEIVPHTYKGTQVVTVTLPSDKAAPFQLSAPFLVSNDVWIDALQMRFNTAHYRRVNSEESGPVFTGGQWAEWRHSKDKAGGWRFHREAAIYSHGECVDFPNATLPETAWGATAEPGALLFGIGCFPLAPLTPAKGSTMKIVAPASFVLTTEPRYTSVRLDRTNNTETFEIPLNPPGADFSLLDLYRFFQYPYMANVVLLRTDLRAPAYSGIARAIWSEWMIGVILVIGTGLGRMLGRVRN